MGNIFQILVWCLQSLLFSLGLDTVALPLAVIVSMEEETVYLPPSSLRLERHLLFLSIFACF